MSKYDEPAVPNWGIPAKKYADDAKKNQTNDAWAKIKPYRDPASGRRVDPNGDTGPITDKN